MRKFTEGLLDNRLILTALNVKRGQTILDAGCGNGYMSKIFSEAVGRSGKVYALDPDKHFIEVLKDETSGSNIEAITGDITKSTRLDGSSFDLIYIATVLHIFSKKQMQGFVREAERLLKPEALLAVVEIEKKETPFGPAMELRRSPDELKETISLLSADTLKVGDHFYMQVFKNKKSTDLGLDSYNKCNYNNYIKIQ